MTAIQTIIFALFWAAIFGSVGGTLYCIATYYCRQSEQIAKRNVQEAILTGLNWTITRMLSQKGTERLEKEDLHPVLDLVVGYIETTVPRSLKATGLDDNTLRTVIEARMEPWMFKSPKSRQPDISKLVDKKPNDVH